MTLILRWLRASTEPGAVQLAEQSDEWAEGRRYLGLEVLARCRLTSVPDTGIEEVPEPLTLTA